MIFSTVLTISRHGWLQEPWSNKSPRRTSPWYKRTVSGINREEYFMRDDALIITYQMHQSKYIDLNALNAALPIIISDCQGASRETGSRKSHPLLSEVLRVSNECKNKNSMKYHRIQFFQLSPVILASQRYIPQSRHLHRSWCLQVQSTIDNTVSSFKTLMSPFLNLICLFPNCVKSIY